MQPKKVLVLLTIKMIFFINILNSQKPELDFFKDYSPKWIHAVFDTSALDSVGYDDNTRILYRNSLLHQSKLIVLYEYLLNYYYGDGGYLVCLDLETGEENWVSIYDLRSIEKNEEPDGLRIDEDGLVEIFGRRYFKKVTDLFQDGSAENVLVVRKYDIGNGDLLEWSFPDNHNSTTGVLKNYHWPVVFYNGNNTYQSFRPFGLSAVEADTKLLAISVDHQGRFIKTDSIIIRDSIYFYIDVGRILLLNDSTFITSMRHQEQFPPNDATLNFKFYIKLYDRKINEIKSIDLTHDFLRARNRNDLQIVFADTEHFVVRFDNEPELFKYWTADNYFYDFDGNLIDSVELFWTNNLTINKVLRLSSDEFLIVGADTKTNNTKYDLHFYKKKLKGPLTLLKVIPMALNEQLIGVEELYLLDNKDILLVGGFYKLDREYQQVLLRRFPLMIRFDGSDIGLVGTNDPGQVVQALEVFPNPVHQTLSFPSTALSGRIFITDMLGRKQEVKAVEKGDAQQIDVSGVTPGCYQLSIINEHGYLTSTARFIKMD